MDAATEPRYKPTELEKTQCDYRKNAGWFDIEPKCEDCAGCHVMVWSIFSTAGYDFTMDDARMFAELDAVPGSEPMNESMTGCYGGRCAPNPLTFIYKLLKEYGI